MGSIAPPQYVAPATVDPHRFGLFSVANMSDPSGRWELGVEWEPIPGERAGLRAHECVGDDPADVDLRVGGDIREGLPFVVVGSYVCGSTSRELTEAEERARLHLHAGEERAVEYAIATGAMGNEPSFQGAEVLTAGAVSLFDGVGLIERALAVASPSVGAIHAPRLLGTFASAMTERFGQRVETLIGNFVAFGGGYDLANVGPDGEAAADGTAWIYGTGRPRIRQSEVWVQPDEAGFIDKETNQVAVMAQRTYLVTWDGPTVAALVNAPGGDAE